jgi:carboxypeptidase Taq
MDFQTKLSQLKTILKEVADLDSATNLLDWDQQCYMPPGGVEDRSNQLATLKRLSHVRFTSDEVGQLLEDLQPYATQLDPDSDEARLIKVTARKYKKNTRVPSEMVAEFAQMTSLAYQIWQVARVENNFTKFSPYLEKIVDWKRRYANLFVPYDHIYDPLLDEFEPGLKTADVKAIFNDLRPQQVTLIQAIADRPQVDDAFLHQPFNEHMQWEFGVKVISKFGYDWNHGRQDKTAHPFSIGFGVRDVRITTRVYPDYLSSALFSTMHECGHALYDMGVDPTFDRTPLADITSLALHESQSRLWENLIGRSHEFWEYYYPRLVDRFPSQLGNVSLEAFYKGINKVKPSLIRVEADEATYNLHIMLRLELEIALVEGNLQVKDLPEAWNARMKEYLGLIPPNDADGVLQDVHWSSGIIGYFSTYALGNLISGQLWECIKADIPNLSDHIRHGEFGELLTWLREKIHRHGSKFVLQEMVQRVTGSKITPVPYMRYLWNKFGDIYGLRPSMS